MPEQIPLKDLIRGKWYVGRGRNGNVGKWDGHCFLVAAEKLDDYVVKEEPYFTADWGCFQPFAMIDEGTTAEPFGTTIWDKHYGHRVEFGQIVDLAQEQARMGNDLIGCWKGSSYYWGGDRLDFGLDLRSDGTFEKQQSTGRTPNSAPSVDHGRWRFDPNELELHLEFDNANAPVRQMTYFILGVTGTTLLVRWLALASRNLPSLLYRVG